MAPSPLISLIKTEHFTVYMVKSILCNYDLFVYVWEEGFCYYCKSDFKVYKL